MPCSAPGFRTESGQKLIHLTMIGYLPSSHLLEILIMRSFAALGNICVRKVLQNCSLNHQRAVKNWEKAVKVRTCLTKFNLKSKNVSAWKKISKSHIKTPGGFIFPTRTLGIEGWDTVNLAKWDALPFHELPVFLTGGEKKSWKLWDSFSKRALELRRKPLNAVRPQLTPSQFCFSLERVLGDGEGTPGSLAANNPRQTGVLPHHDYYFHADTSCQQYKYGEIQLLTDEVQGFLIINCGYNICSFDIHIFLDRTNLLMKLSYVNIIVFVHILNLQHIFMLV